MNKPKDSNPKEPASLRRGKKFEKDIKENWPEQKQKYEKSITKPSGKKGRIDVFVDAAGADDEDLVAVVEIKASDWDKMTGKAVKRNVNRQINQVWDYIESQLEEGKHVSPGIIFPERPRDPKRMKLIEELFDERGIPVVWEDESIEERKGRSK